LAEELKAKFGVTATLVKLSGGIFEVYRNDELIFSKRSLGRFPNNNEVIDLITALENGTPLEQAQSETSKSTSGGGLLQRFLQMLKS
jgi:selT/selW/selH-like putative selenoprotein